MENDAVLNAEMTVSSDRFKHLKFAITHSVVRNLQQQCFVVRRPVPLQSKFNDRCRCF